MIPQTPGAPLVPLEQSWKWSMIQQWQDQEESLMPSTVRFGQLVLFEKLILTY